MIPKQDLRIGNSVMYDNRIFQISAITDEFPLLNTPEFGIGVVDWNNIHPIPITEEALVKMNIAKANGYPYKFLNGYIKIRNGNYFFKYYELEIPITSIHSLQNLYYSLKQTELTYD